MADAFSTRVAQEGREVRLLLSGPLEVHHARDLARSFDDALYLNPGRGLVVDMAAVTSVDGDAATLLLDWLRTAMRERRSVRIVDAPPPIEHRIRLLGIIAAYGGYPLASVAGRAAESTQER